MEKLQNELKNMIDEVHVPTDKLNAAVDEALKKGRRKHIHNSKGIQRLIVSTVAAAVIGISGIIYSAHHSTQADDPLSDSLLYHYGDEGIQRVVEKGKAQRLNLVAEDQGMKIILEEGYLDDSQMVISYRVEGEKFHNLNNHISMLDLTVDDNSSINTGIMLNPKGGLITFSKASLFKIPDQPNIELNINSVGHVDGNWSFNFELKKEEELFKISYFDRIVQKDNQGNSFAITEAKLTPSQLMFRTKLDIKPVSWLQDTSVIEVTQLSVQKDGLIIPEDGFLSYENTNGELERENQYFYETSEMPRKTDAHTYRFVPYIATYNGQKEDIDDYGTKELIRDTMSVPFKVGSTIKINHEIELLDFYEKNEKLIVHFKMNKDLPVFPWLSDNYGENYNIQSFKIHDNYIEAHYPKIKNIDNLSMNLYDGNYHLLSDLIIDLEFK
ncbi:DUF4179 domain-containing protein [Bacillus sp. CRN 9]|nr:DUF4179 domain-containing protein [Bacillus sp. CRN 9]